MVGKAHPASSLFHKAGLQDKTFDFLDIAFDLFFVVGKTNIPDHGAAFERYRGAFDLLILDGGDRITVNQHIAVTVFYNDHDFSLEFSAQFFGIVGSDFILQIGDALHFDLDVFCSPQGIIKNLFIFDE